MTGDELNRYLIPASRWQNFPIIARGLKGHWAIWREEGYDATQKPKVAFYIGEIQRRTLHLVKVGHKELLLSEVWIVPGHVPLQPPRYDWNRDTSKPLGRDQLMAVLADGLERIGAEPWAEQEVVND